MNFLEEAMEILRRQRFLEQVNGADGALRRDPAKWNALERERRRQWDATLADGLEVAEGREPYRVRPRARTKRSRK
jgi:hypothetical protein